MMHYIPKTIRGLGVIAVLVIAAAFVYWFLGSSIIKTQTDITRLEGAIAEVRAAEASAAKAEAQLAVLETQKATLQKAFVTDDTLVQFLEQIEGLGKNSSTTVKVISVDNSGEKKDTYRLSVLADGSWKGVAQVFRLIEALPVSVSIDKTKFDLREANHWQGMFDFTVERGS